jgi:predicted RNA-binding Zn-ribbon protein involved in translation (DUF1610 family)
MAKAKKNRKPPSRKRYEEKHPTISFRLDKETYKCLKGHLEGTGCSIADFIKDALGKEESMIEKRVEILASKQMGPPVEDRLKCVEDLTLQILPLAVDTDKYPPFCPHCGNQKLLRCEGREVGSTSANSWAPTWKCPKCGFFMNTYKRIDPKSIQWTKR